MRAWRGRLWGHTPGRCIGRRRKPGRLLRLRLRLLRLRPCARQRQRPRHARRVARDARPLARRARPRPAPPLLLLQHRRWERRQGRLPRRARYRNRRHNRRRPLRAGHNDTAGPASADPEGTEAALLRRRLLDRRAAIPVWAAHLLETGTGGRYGRLRWLRGLYIHINKTAHNTRHVYRTKRTA